MDVTMIIELVSTLGLPIVLVGVMGWFIYKIYKKSEQREDTLMAEIAENRKINAQAIETITLYAERLTHIEGNIEEIKEDIKDIKGGNAAA